MTKNKNKSNLKGLKITNNVVRTEIKILLRADLSTNANKTQHQ